MPLEPGRTLGPNAVTSGPDRLARFEREAKVLASLNHNDEVLPSSAEGVLR